MAYDLSQLKLEGIEIKNIINCQISQIPGEHGELSLTGYVENDKFEEAQSLQPLRLYSLEESEENIFCGVLTAISQEARGQLLMLHIEAKGYTYLLDLQKKYRTFQDISKTYSEILHQILDEYEGADCIVAQETGAIGNLEIQYQETDWNFFKRIYSKLYIPLAGEIRIPAIRIYAGVPALNMNQQDYELTEMSLDFKLCSSLKEIGYELSESDVLDCLIKTDKTCGIFTSFYFCELFMVVAGVKAYMHQGVMQIELNLRKKEGIVAVPQFPMALVGLALEGSVLEVKGESVRMHFFIDDGYPVADVYWFTYSTPSASPDGSGWYYMPEIGDRLRVYFPTKYLKDALAISAVSSYKGTGEPDRMADPSSKYLRSASGQEMNMGGNGIYLASAGKAASLMIGTDGGIQVKGNVVEITADESIDINAETNIEFHSSTGAIYRCEQGGCMELDISGNLKISGSKLNID